MAGVNCPRNARMKPRHRNRPARRDITTSSSSAPVRPAFRLPLAPRARPRRPAYRREPRTGRPDLSRSITTTPVSDRAVLGEDYWRGAAIVARFERSATSYAARCTVWSIAPYDDDMRGGAFEIGLSLDGRARLITGGTGHPRHRRAGAPLPDPGLDPARRDDGRRRPDRAEELGDRPLRAAP
jgi:hypothetical protein